ncbi:bone morphogenetic protein receptor type-1B-like [Clavelina lepadiformis]|uniref:bone morphogenetic protein receptor type-1B-like n=1 Tax=Clavelina lepadiformis TaxID=159417 RepID=UPI0040436896
MDGGVMRCRCLLDCPDGTDNSTCILKPNAKCFKKVFRNDYGEDEVRAGCLGSLDENLDQCSKFADPTFERPTMLECCNNVTMCNDFLDLHLPKDDLKETGYEFNMDMVIVIAVSVLIFFFIFGGFITLYCLRLCRRESERRRQIEVENRHGECPVIYGDKRHCLQNGKHKAIRDMMDEWSSLGMSSGSGMPLLVQRTISKQVEIVGDIGAGRYGTVKLGKWREEKVAIKIFFSKDEDSWFRETEIYQTVMLRHENILGFIAADISGSGSCTQLYLITEYHERGSLFDYLQNNMLGVAEALKLSHSACCGLAHLHTEITGTQGKPAIAHRDIKSKNILVKRDGQCCIADMGLAVRYSRSQGKVDIGSYDRSRRQGTKRYMAPEVLAQTYRPDSFEAYIFADVYSFALVMWEIANRTIVKGIVEDYHVPYYDVVEPNPDFDEMWKVVVIEKIRPEILPQWAGHRIMSSYGTTMQECWKSRPESRLSILRVRKTLSALRQGGLKEADFGSASSDSGTDRKPSASSTSNISSTEKSDNSENVNSRDDATRDTAPFIV